MISGVGGFVVSMLVLFGCDCGIFGIFICVFGIEMRFWIVCMGIVDNLVKI